MPSCPHTRRAGGWLLGGLLFLAGCAATQPAADGAAGDGATNVAELIQARFPGVDVARTADGTYRVRIRDGARLNDAGEPLYVVNGAPTGPNVLSDLAPQDVAAIRILKGPQAAIYGHRGANGAVVITTKGGE